MITIIVKLTPDTVETNTEEFIQNECYIYLIMITLFKNLFKMSTKSTKFVSYKPGPPESMFLD